MRNAKAASEEKGTHVTVSLGISGKEIDPLAVIGGITEGIRNMEPELRDAIRRAREEGRSWQEIAEKLGVSRQAAWERYREVEEDPISAAAGSLGPLKVPTEEMRRRFREEEVEAEQRRERER